VARRDTGEGVIGWILLSREAVARAEQALNSDEKGVRDELGFLALHQGFADRFFPGTSVLHTRLRYALFVPWLMEQVATGDGSDLRRRLTVSETALAGQLKKGKQSDPDADGIIGGRVWPRHAAQPPSFSYWTALGSWGILRPSADGSLPSRIETLRRLAQRNPMRRSRVTDDDGGALEHDAVSPFVKLPDPPEALGTRDEPLDFRLTECERAFLRKQLLGVRRPNTTSPSLLARLAEIPAAPDAADPWSREIVGIADEEDKFALTVARHASALAGIGRGAYAALTELVRSKDGLPDTTKQWDHLRTMIDRYGDDARALNFGELTRLLNNLSGHLINVLTATQEWLKSKQTDLTTLRSVYAKAEQARKGLRARLPDNVAGRQRRVEWDPLSQPLAEPLHYRWDNVRRLMTDLKAS
jgi:hypothetical protein